MGKLCKYDVAGHLFEVLLPDGIDAGQYLAAYSPFVTESSDAPLFTLRIEYVDDLKAMEPGSVKECLNDESPYFWIFDKASKSCKDKSYRSSLVF